MRNFPRTVLHVVAMMTACVPAACTAPAGAPAPPMAVASRLVTGDGTTVVKLGNGMTVIVKPVRTSPVVCVRCYVRAGGLYEGKWLGAGISHLVEHLVAKEAAGPDRIGGQSNAYTSLDHTCYYISAAAGKTLECIDLIADWMARPEITAEEFKREHGVVQRELEMGKDDPGKQMWLTSEANLFGSHPAGVPVIGYAGPLAGLTRRDVLDYHSRMYVPQNMVFCVVGDVDVEAVLARCRKAFAGFERGRTPDRSLPPVEAVAGTRRLERRMPALKDTMERLSFQTVPLVHEDLYALDVLSFVLTRGRSSRLVKVLERRRKLVTSISSGSWTPAWGRGALTFSFRADPDKADQAEKALLAELARVAAEGVSDEELARAKKQKIAEHVYSQQTVDAIAGTLATDYLSTGDTAFSGNYTRRIQAVTAEQVHAAAGKYFTFDRMVITRLRPPVKQPATWDAAAAAASSTTTFTAPDGTKVILHSTNAVELVSMTHAVAGGLLVEDEKTNGLGMLMMQLSTKGAGPRSAEQIAAFFDGAGGSISAGAGSNTFYWRATVLREGFDEALDIFADVLGRPTFADKELEILRPKLLAAVKHVDEEWFSQLNKFFRGKFFAGSPYRFLPSGSESVVKAATAGQVRRHHRKHVLGRPGVLAIYGRFDAARAGRKLRKLLTGSRPQAMPIAKLPPRKVAPEGEFHKLPTTNRQAAIMVAAPGMTVADVDDRLAITVLETILSGYHLPSGPLHSELRGKRLVYVVHAYNWAGMQPGAFVAYAGCRPEKAHQVVDIIHKQLSRTANYKPTQDQVNRAVNTIVTAELLGNQAMSALSMQAALDELYGLGYDFRRKLAAAYRKITPEDVLRAGAKYLAGGLVTCVTTPKPELLTYPVAAEGAE